MLTLIIVAPRYRRVQWSVVGCKSRARGDVWMAATYRREVLNALFLMVSMRACLNVSLGALRLRSSCVRSEHTVRRNAECAEPRRVWVRRRTAVRYCDALYTAPPRDTFFYTHTLDYAML